MWGTIEHIALIAIITNTCIQSYWLYRTYFATSSSKHTNQDSKHTIKPSEDFPTQSIGSLPAGFIHQPE